MDSKTTLPARISINHQASIISVVLQDVPPPISTGAKTFTPKHHLRPRRRRSPALKSPKNKRKSKQEDTKNTRSRVVCNIKHHLRVRVKRGEPHTDNVDGHAEIVRHGKRKFVTSANYPGIRGRKPIARRKNGALRLVVRLSERCWINIY